LLIGDREPSALVPAVCLRSAWMGVSLARSDSLARSISERRTSDADGPPMGPIIAISRTTNRPAWLMGVPIKDEQRKVVGVLAKTNG